jgi:hypothetical protein
MPSAKRRLCSGIKPRWGQLFLSLVDLNHELFPFAAVQRISVPNQSLGGDDDMVPPTPKLSLIGESQSSGGD